MKNIINTLIVIIIAASFSSCTKVIDVNLENVPTKYVIQGEVADSSTPWVKINKMIDVDKNNEFPAVTDAIVTITDNHGNTYKLASDNDGVYKTANTIGTPGDTYTLTVEIGSETFTASSTMPKKVFIDSLGIRAFRFGPEETNFANVHYTDPVGKGNNYRAILKHNDTLRSDIYIEDDKYSDGNAQEATLFSQSYSLVPGDTFIVEMQCIDRAVYNYLSILNEVDGSSGLASPANPQSNISGGALGYFSAHTSVTMGKRVE